MANLEHLCCSDSDSDNGSTDGGKSTANKTKDTVDFANVSSLHHTRENIGDSKDASFFSGLATAAGVLGTPPTMPQKKS